MPVTIAAYQGKPVYGDISKNLNTIKKVLIEIEEMNVDVICFPECFLQGYILEKDKALEAGLDLASNEFQVIMRNICSKTTIILGQVEKEIDKIFNTAVVIENGKLIGKYCKHNLLKKEKIFTPGSTSPIFDKNGINYGINICSDTRNGDSANEMAKKGAKVLFFPLNNSLPYEIADKWKGEHMGYWVKIALETSCWILTSDVIEKSEKNIGYGFTSLINPEGEVVKKVRYLEEGLIVHAINL